LSFLEAKLDKKWSTNKNCEACHQKISKYWETSRHANAHFSKNDLYKKSLEYIVLKNPQLLVDEMKVKCAKCHNPRISKTAMSDKEKILLAFEDESVTKEFKDMLNSEQMKHGINCVVCHNIEEIHLDKSKGSQGLHGVKFGKQGTMFGPFSDANSPYHKTAFKEHFSDNSPKLCFTCHYSHQNEHGVEVYSTGKEYDAINSEEGCKSCHMSQKKKGVASDYAPFGQKPKTRMVRDHRFASVDNSSILMDNIVVKSHREAESFTIELTNNSPHAIPTGYGLREIKITAIFYDVLQNVMSQKDQLLSAVWHDKQGKPTLPFMAVKKAKDTRLGAKSSQKYIFDIPKHAAGVKYTITYRFIGLEMAKAIKLSDPFFLKEYKVTEGSLDF
jgi:hypothetical protein